MHVGGSRAFSKNAHLSFLDNRADAERVELDLAPGQFQAPVWSPDGNYIYYIAAEAEVEAIYRMQASTLERKVVTNLSGVAFMVLSPTDQHIAYLQFEPGTRIPFGKPYLVNTDGSNHKLLAEFLIASMYWAPDGQKLALLGFTRSNEGPSAKIDGLAAPLPQEAQLRWWIYDVEAETLEPLTSFSPTTSFLQIVPFFDQYHLSLTFWSPDSHYFVITKRENEAGAGTVWVYDTTGEEEARQVGQGTLAVWSWR
jgi:Tol biopolymer transport system component